MSRIGEKIKEERLKKGISPKQLGKKCGVSETYILDIEGGKKIINERLVAQISKALEVNIEETIINETAVIEEKKPEVTTTSKSPLPQQIKRAHVEPLPQWEDALSNIIKRIPIYEGNFNEVKGYKSFPIIDKKVEGFNPEKLVYLEVLDNNLSQYRIQKGDRCLIYITQEVTNGAIHLVEYDRSTYLRKIKKVHNNVEILDMPSNSVIITDQKKVKIIGRLVRVEIDF